MALSLSDITDLFTNIGKVIALADECVDLARGQGSASPDFPQRLSDIETAINGVGSPHLLEGMTTQIEGFQSVAAGFGATLRGTVARIIRDKRTILDLLDDTVSGADLQAILREIFRDMTDQVQSVNETTVSIGIVNVSPSNRNTHAFGQLVGHRYLDGVSAPLSNAEPNLGYAGLRSELANQEALDFTCELDSEEGGVAEGFETWRIRGLPAVSYFDRRLEGSGTDVTFETLNATEIIANRDFEAWAANIPTSWDLDSGVAGTDIVQETTSANVVRGSSSIQFNPAAGTVQISQDVNTIIDPQRFYVLTVWVKGDAGITAGDLTIQFESTSGGYVASGSERIKLSAATLAAGTTWDIKEFFWLTPNEIPEDLELIIKTGGLTGGIVHVDSLAFGPLTYANGIGWALSAGENPFLRGDRFSSFITNDGAGVFQEFFRRGFLFQLPSSSTPTIADSLAT